MTLWKTIAKNEIKLRTNKFRDHRILFFIILYAFLSIWAFYLAPWLFDFIMSPFLVAIPDPVVFNSAIALVVEYILMAFFLTIVIYPINSIYRRVEIGFKETILAFQDVSPAALGARCG